VRRRWPGRGDAPRAAELRRAGATLALVIGLLVVGGVLGSTAAGYIEENGENEAAENPCLGSKAALLRCPDLQMRRPFDLWIEHTRGGRALLHAGSAIKNRGRGPVELHGKLNEFRTMRARQRIYGVGHKHLVITTGGHLSFYFIPGQGRYWKFTNAARFELWSVDGKGGRKRLVRTGPKVHYCFRDLEKTSPSPRTPRARVYPGCSQNPRKRRVTLGTSVGWSDIYPSTYYEQWIDVSGLRGCFAYVQVADPKNHIFESHEENNDAQRIVRLPFHAGPSHCTH
jgi:hypothetical protein